MINIYGNGDLIEVKDKIDNRIDGQQSIDLISQKRFRDMWDQRYRLKASNSAQNVFLFILARTFTFHKVKEIISLRDMSKGMCDRDGNVIIDGIGISITMIKRVIIELEELNYIIKTKRCDKSNSVLASMFEININYFNEEIKKAHNMENKEKIKNKGLEKVKTKKHFINNIPEGYLTNQGITLATTVTGPQQLECPSKPEYNSIELYSNKTWSKDTQPIGCDEDLEGKYKRVYDNEMRANYPGQYIPPHGETKQAKQMRGQLKNLYKKLITIEKLDILKFIQFSIQEWKHVCTTKLYFLEQHSKSSLPVSPQIGIILKFTDKFLEAFRASGTDPDAIQTIYGDGVGFRAKELQKMGHTAEFAMKRAVLESEVANTQKSNADELVEVERRKYELEMAKLRKEQDYQLTAMQNELRRVKEEAEKVKYSDIFNFSLNNMVDPDL